MSLAHQISENEIMVFGGKAKNNVVTKQAYVFNTETYTIKEGPHLRNPSSFMNTLVSYDDHFYVFGNDVYIHRFSLVDHTWQVKNKHINIGETGGVKQDWM